MTVASVATSRAFAVWFKDLQRWDCGFYKGVAWHWPADRLRPVGSVLSRKQLEVSPELDKVDVPIIEKISFGGQVSLTAPGDRIGYKGRLFWAHAGDLIYSKIRVKQGSLAVVPEEIETLAVSSEYPVYSVNHKQVDSTYLSLVLKSRPFLSLFEGLSHGGSTKTRIPPAEFERQLIPLPPLSDQRAIVASWRRAQDEISASQTRIEKRTAELDSRFFSDLELKSPDALTMPKALAAWWKDVLRWGVRFNQLRQVGADITLGKYPVVELDSLLELVQYGTSEKANTRNEGVPIIRMNNVIDGQLDLKNLKHLSLQQREVDRLALKEGDILFNRTNSKALVGKCAVFHAEGEFVFASYLIRVRADETRADPEYLAHVINSPIGRQQINALSRQIIGQANVNSEELRSLKIPLPPVAVQKRIMRHVAAGRAEIARERTAAEDLAREIDAEIEAIILGTKPLWEQ
jgi:type I restriction enzyme, S subunit